jgi:hypothetical protein
VEGVCYTSSVLATSHLSILGRSSMKQSFPDRALMNASSPKAVTDAADVASAALSRAGVRHAIAGGLAVSAHGYGRATKDVDFLVGEEAFEHHAGGVVTMRAGLPIQVAGVLVDFLSIQPNEAFLESALSKDGGIIGAEALVYLKLKSPRAKDRVDIMELVKAGLNAPACRDYLTTNAAQLLAKFEEAVAAAYAEE